MKKRILLFIGLAFISASAVAAQTRAVTNEDLEIYRQKRLAAERDLRENYERLGFPSPAEMQKQIERSNAERSALSARLEAEKLQRDQLDLERQRSENDVQNRNRQYQTENNQRYEGNYFPGYGLSGFYGFPNLGYQNNIFNRGYRDGFGNHRNFGNQPRVEYRNNLPVIVQPPPPRILAPR